MVFGFIVVLGIVRGDFEPSDLIPPFALGTIIGSGFTLFDKSYRRFWWPIALVVNSFAWGLVLAAASWMEDLFF